MTLVINYENYTESFDLQIIQEYNIQFDTLMDNIGSTCIYNVDPSLAWALP